MIIPIFVPLYNSFHIIDKFVERVYLEKNLDFRLFYFINDGGIKLFDRNPIPMPEFAYEEWSTKNVFYSEAINKSFIKMENIDKEMFDDKFIILTPDCYPIEENWLTRMVDIWDRLKEKDNNICTLGSLQFSNIENNQATVWHFGTFLKEEKDKCHPLDWRHNMFYNNQEYIRCDGNTGAGIMIDRNKFKELNMFDSIKYPHYSSDADFCLRASKKGYTHYCSNVQFFHKAGTSSEK